MSSLITICLYRVFFLTERYAFWLTSVQETSSLCFLYGGIMGKPPCPNNIFFPLVLGKWTSVSVLTERAYSLAISLAPLIPMHFRDNTEVFHPELRHKILFTSKIVIAAFTNWNVIVTSNSYSSWLLDLNKINIVSTLSKYSFNTHYVIYVT